MALKKGKWIQAATEKMKEKGTLGSFGKVTAKKVSAAKKEGGKEEKKAIFAENMKEIAMKHKHGKKKG
jgi:hypothetical protein